MTDTVVNVSLDADADSWFRRYATERLHAAERRLDGFNDRFAADAASAARSAASTWVETPAARAEDVVATATAERIDELGDDQFAVFLQIEARHLRADVERWAGLAERGAGEGLDAGAITEVICGLPDLIAEHVSRAETDFADVARAARVLAATLDAVAAAGVDPRGA